MYFDDRLATVLRLPEAGEAMARIQYVQLIDILGRLPVDARSAAIDAGLHRLADLGATIPVAERARLLARSSQPLTNARLIAVLAEGDPEVARAAIANSRLDDAEWLALIPALPVNARGVLRHQRDLSAPVKGLLAHLGIHDRGLPNAPTQEPDAANEPSRFSAPTGDVAVDQDVSDDVLELLDFASNPPPPTSLSEWARSRAAQHRDQPREQLTPVASEAGIGAIVRRIEEFRRAREKRKAAYPDTGPDAPRLPLGDTQPGAPRLASSLDFATDTEGRVTWADGPHAPSVIGIALASAECADTQGTLSATIRRHLPLRGVLVHLAGAPAIAGEWQVDAVPRFHPADGRFTGHVGRLRRPAHRARAGARGSDGSDYLRQILHELRTPANAIQVAAEIIQQQLYGPAPHEYRALAAAIAGDCAHILAGFEELDRLARLETGALEPDPGNCDLAEVFVQTVARLSAWTDPRGSSFALPAQPSPLPVSLDRMEAERMVWRLLAALAASMAPGEVLPLEWRADEGRLVIDITLPATLAAREPEALFDALPGERGQSLAAGLFGTGFSLRLATAEAAAARGSLVRQADILRLTLPALTVTHAGNSTQATG